MIGLFAAVSENELDFSISDDNSNYLVNSEKSNNYYVYQSTIKKFESDKVWFSDESKCVITDGVIIDFDSAASKSDMSYKDALLSYIRKDSLVPFLKSTRGSFSGIIVDKAKRTITAYTDHLNSKPLFYFRNNKVVIVSSSVRWIVEFLKKNSIQYSLDLIGAYSLATYGYMYGTHTLIKGIEKVPNGSIVIFDNDIMFEQYYELKKKAIDVSEEEAINNINSLFVSGLEKQINKNNAQKYINAIPLSAGMDCRLTSYAFNKIVDEPALNFTYSETGEYDFITPPQMAHQLKNRWIFKSLDNGLELFNIEEAIEVSDGLIYYSWPAQLLDFLKFINTSDWGIIHTGVLGDIVIGTFVKQPDQRHRMYRLGDGAFSLMLINKLKSLVKVEEIDYELGMIKNRGFNGACMGYSATFKYYAEDMSPFLNIDLLDYCLSLPIEMRERHNIYYKWVQKFYPQALNYKHNGVTAKGSLKVSIGGKQYRIRTLPDLVKNTFRKRFQKNYGMNPMQSWYDNNLELKRYMDSYFKDNVTYLKLCTSEEELKMDIEKLYYQGTAREKIQAISLVGSVKMLFG